MVCPLFSPLFSLESLVSYRISTINVSPVSYDLRLLFNDSLRLTVFCDQTNIEDSIDNYSFFTPQKVYTIETQSVLSYECRL